MNAPDAEPGPWPREGETWGPAFPWPASGCPVGLYIHGYSEALVGGAAGWTFGIKGVTWASPGLPPMSPETETAMAWEFRCGSTNIKERCTPHPFAAGSGMRVGPEPIVVDAVGAGNVYGHYLDGRPVILPALDLRRGWACIGGERCTGITARWCPKCGDCKCPPPAGLAGDMDSPGCPLHALDSAHGEDADPG